MKNSYNNNVDLSLDLSKLRHESPRTYITESQQSYRKKYQFFQKNNLRTTMQNSKFNKYGHVKPKLYFSLIQTELYKQKSNEEKKNTLRELNNIPKTNELIKLNNDLLEQVKTIKKTHVP